MKKLRLWEMLLILLTVAFILFLVGFFIGRGSVFRSRDGVVIETEKGTAIPETPVSPLPADTAPAAGASVNINSADKETLMSLPGIGEELAQRILDYRDEHGRFRSKDELMDVSGIGEGKYEACKDLITIN